MSVKQPFGPAPTPGWARSEPAGYSQPPDVGEDSVGDGPVGDVPVGDGPAISEATTGGSATGEVGAVAADPETGSAADIGSVEQDADADDVVAASEELNAEPAGVGAATEPLDTADGGLDNDVVTMDGPVEERVRRQVAALDGIADLPLSVHAQRYDEVHAELQAALTEIDGESS